MKRTFTKILFLSITFISSSFCQGTLSEQHEFAVKLYGQENYFDAVTELKRLLFFDDNNEYRFSAHLLMGKAYKAGARLNDAVYHFTQAEINSGTDEEFYESRIELVKVNILRRTTAQALKLLDNLEENQKFKEKIDEINYWRGWAYIFSDDFNNASEVFGRIDNEHELRLLSLNTTDEKYSESFAKIFSVFIPGAGQIYTGNYLNGIVSLAWNVFAGYLTINSFVEDRIFDGIIIGNLLWLRFYLGNVQNAEEFAREKNLEITNKTMEYLQKEYLGPKP
ncbi:MAG: hypothetical protein R6W90_04085 [Ignavibacteriaceae bacterium]